VTTFKWDFKHISIHNRVNDKPLISGAKLHQIG
jgi:hypothetical protein